MVGNIWFCCISIKDEIKVKEIQSEFQQNREIRERFSREAEITGREGKKLDCKAMSNYFSRKPQRISKSGKYPGRESLHDRQNLR